MKRDIAEKWIADLRAGPPQARGQLFNGEGYCCLGRLCVLAGLEPSRLSDSVHYSFKNNIFSLPNEVRDWAGMRTINGDFGKVDHLAIANDSGKTFAEIADIIEAHIDEL